MMIMIRKCPPCENWPDQKYTCGKYNERPKEDILRMLGKLKKKRIMLITILVFIIIFLGFSSLKEKSLQNVADFMYTLC